jgi:hypothetical protein
MLCDLPKAKVFVPYALPSISRQGSSMAEHRFRKWIRRRLTHSPRRRSLRPNRLYLSSRSRSAGFPPNPKAPGSGWAVTSDDLLGCVSCLAFYGYLPLGAWVVSEWKVNALLVFAPLLIWFVAVGVIYFRGGGPGDFDGRPPTAGDMGPY